MILLQQKPTDYERIFYKRIIKLLAAIFSGDQVSGMIFWSLDIPRQTMKTVKILAI
jgi:hypothetical protein